MMARPCRNGSGGRPAPRPPLFLPCAVCPTATPLLPPPPQEMEDVRWFPREDIVAAIAGDAGAAGGRLRVPPSMAIAHVLLRAYATGYPACVFGEAAAPAVAAL